MPHGWTDLSCFTPKQVKVRAAAKQLSKIATLETFSITHIAEHMISLSPHDETALVTMDILYEHHTHYRRHRVRGVNKVSLKERSPC